MKKLIVIRKDNGDGVYNTLHNTGFENELQAYLYEKICNHTINNPELLSSKIIQSINEYFEHIDCEFHINKKHIVNQNVKNGNLI